MLDTDFCLKAAKQALIAAEKELVPRFRRDHPGKWRYKKHAEIVTEADLAADRAIIRTLKRLTPDFGILTEESPKPAGPDGIRWIVDPLDGTTNYTAHLPLWGISLALAADGEVFLGAISLPTLGERYFAVADQGAWAESGPVKKPIRVSDQKKIKDSFGLFCYGYLPEEKERGLRHVADLTHKSRTTRRLGSAVFESVWVATGRGEYSVLHGIKPWDVAAGALIVREAGGEALTPQGKRWTLADPDYLAVCPGVKKQILRIFSHG